MDAQNPGWIAWAEESRTFGAQGKDALSEVREVTRWRGAAEKAGRERRRSAELNRRNQVAWAEESRAFGAPGKDALSEVREVTRRRGDRGEGKAREATE